MHLVPSLEVTNICSFIANVRPEIVQVVPVTETVPIKVLPLKAIITTGVAKFPHVPEILVLPAITGV